MESLGNLLIGFGVALTPYNILIVTLGVFLGVVIGVLPGLGGTSGVAILLPLTFVMEPTSAIIFLSSIYWGALFGGVITSILFNIPGEPWSVAATFDGYPLAKQGSAGYALSVAFIGGFFGSFIAIILFSFFAPPLAELALQFGPPEYFAVMLLAFSTFVGLGGGSAIKNLTSALIGFLLASVGLDIVTGTPRLTVDTVVLLSGFNFVIVCIGLFGIGEILLSAEESLAFTGEQAKIGLRDILATLGDMFRRWYIWFTSTLLGFWIGVLPGTGATPASFMAYGIAKQYSKSPEKFGTGVMEGVLSTQSAAQAAGIGSLLPLVTLGVPGSPTAAVMLGGLYIWGLQPGPLLFIEKPDFVWGLIASMYIGNVVGLLMCLFLVPLFAAILRIPYAILAPVIVLVSTVGSYAVNNRLFDVWLMLFFGVVGYTFKKLQIPLAPLAIALVLGDMTETALRQSFIMSQGSLGIFFTRPIAATCSIVAVFLFAFPTIRLLLPWMRDRLWTPQGGG
ncbi:MAG TPA: tripartite tricarboxylate transporter permease [Candidatus Udaeobacter sp.]|jgi:putative tricarboxylic transport membrane protein|nr:tripartite tricarboxylate transporter permease [Candidatus Udaeobacter sp.]